MVWFFPRVRGRGSVHLDVRVAVCNHQAGVSISHQETAHSEFIIVVLILISKQLGILKTWKFSMAYIFYNFLAHFLSFNPPCLFDPHPCHCACHSCLPSNHSTVRASIISWNFSDSWYSNHAINISESGFCIPSVSFLEAFLLLWNSK